ncbi:MAG: hypothetical protein IJT58_06530 [Synergistaceae bacterium]|nr:hypothetical protein [Synergistaceae bacterium]
MRKFLAVLALLLLPSFAGAFELPAKVAGWESSGEQVVPLITRPDNIELGRCVYKSYVREAPFCEVQVILTEGKGPGTLYVPDEIKNSGGLFPSSSGYKVMSVGGRRAILETNENLPMSLAVRVDDNVTLTIESNALDESEIVIFAEKLLTSNAGI